MKQRITNGYRSVAVPLGALAAVVAIVCVAAGQPFNLLVVPLLFNDVAAVRVVGAVLVLGAAWTLIAVVMSGSPAPGMFTHRTRLNPAVIVALAILIPVVAVVLWAWWIVRVSGIPALH